MRAQLCPILCDLMDCSLPGSSVHGSSQAEYWSGVPFPLPGESSQPRDGAWVSCVSCIAGGFFSFIGVVQSQMTEGKWVVSQGKIKVQVGVTLCLQSRHSCLHSFTIFRVLVVWTRSSHHGVGGGRGLFFRLPSVSTMEHQLHTPRWYHWAPPAAATGKSGSKTAQGEWRARGPGGVSCSLHLQPGAATARVDGAGSLLRGSSVSNSRNPGPAKRLINDAWNSDSLGIFNLTCPNQTFNFSPNMQLSCILYCHLIMWQFYPPRCLGHSLPISLLYSVPHKAPGS